MNNLLPFSPTNEYSCQTDLNLYDTADCQELATQAKQGRQLIIVEENNQAIKVSLCEDKYQAWLPLNQVQYLQPASNVYQAQRFSRREIEAKIPDIISFCQQAKLQTNYYLWGGTVAPNYDCSGLIQAAFSHLNIWLPRDSYQQAEFSQNITKDELLPGDLIFFATGNKRINHVALYLGNDEYIHSSGKDHGRNGIGIDKIVDNPDPVTHFYYQHICQFGRIISNY